MAGLIENVEADTPSNAAMACSVRASWARVWAACDRVELRLRLCDVEAGSDAGAVALLGEAESACIGLHRVIENRGFGIEAPQLHVVIDQLRDQRRAFSRSAADAAALASPATTSLRICPHRSSWSLTLPPSVLSL